MTDLLIYVPADPERPLPFRADQGAAIVGHPVPEQEQLVRAFSFNLHTGGKRVWIFANRVQHAARALADGEGVTLPAAALTAVGHFDAEHQRVIIREQDEDVFCRWLGRKFYRQDLLVAMDGEQWRLDYRSMIAKSIARKDSEETSRLLREFATPHPPPRAAPAPRRPYPEQAPDQ